MCGIAGFISRMPTEAAERLIQAMTDSVAHRGPDGAGIFVEGRVALGHRRLAILDLSELGHQPMVEPASGCVISFNGEIYNYIEIREELRSHGYVFGSNTDTEVILKAYAHWGADCVARFNGMWAFAIYDPTKQLVFCSRDRFGVKPFYYTESGGVFAFGSEIRQLLGIVPNVAADAEVLLGFLTARIAEDTCKTFFTGVNKLPGGHNLIYDLASGRYRVERFYSVKEACDVAEMTLQDQLKVFSGLFEDAIRLRLRSDVRVGTCLSGGLDSSSIATLAARSYAPADHARFFAITAVSEDPARDESRFAKIVADDLGLEWLTVRPTYGGFCKMLGPTVRAQEEPFASASIVMQHFVMQSARRAGIPVLLDGQGGDEALLGYERYFADHCVQELKNGRVLTCLRFLGDLARNGRAGAFHSLIWNSLYFHVGGLKCLFHDGQNELFDPALRSVAGKRGGYRRTYDSMFEMQKIEIERTNLPALLRYEDKNSMWHSVETRLPFLDYRLVEFALSVGAARKLKEGWAKFLLRKAMDGKMSDQIVWRKNKFGFEAPEAKWMLAHDTALRAAIQNSALLAVICRKGALRGERLSRLRAGMRWRLYSTALWAQEFGVAAVA
jgi:asparagine synthase (glutamine-hydrolysing)